MTMRAPRLFRRWATSARRSISMALRLVAIGHALRQQYRDLHVTAAKRPAARRLCDRLDILLSLDPIGLEAAMLEHRLSDRTHRHLPRIEVVELAAHRHQQHARDGAVLQD